MTCCCENPLQLCKTGTGCTDYVRTGFNAPEAGLYVLVTDFCGAVIQIGAVINEGEEIIFPTAGLNENYLWTGQVLDTNNEPLTFTSNAGEIYDCIQFETALVWNLGTVISDTGDITGTDGGLTKKFIAAEDMPAGVAVISENNFIYRFDPMDILHIGRVIGITKEAGISGDEIPVQLDGILTNPDFNFVINRPVFAGVGGVLGSPVPAVMLIQAVGNAIDVDTLAIRVDLPLKRKL